ncbi:MAG: hypothetical protein AAGB16_01975 [Pseudomonadota bacterium]
MFSKALLAGAAMLAFPLTAQSQVQSEGMSDITAWGARYLEASETEFPTRLWQGSSDETLLALMKDVNTTRITPAERKLLRRAILSPTRRPTGDLADELLAERARLMLALGEAEAASELVPRLETQARGIDAEALAIDLALARGDELTACRPTKSAAAMPEGLYWRKLLAVCAVLEENYARAEFAIELANAQGLDDDWFISAIFAASGDVPNPPNARFDTGMNIALSAKANLDQSRITTSSSRPDLAAAAALRPGMPPELAERFASIAAEVALLSVDDQRRILMARMDEPDFTPANAIQAVIHSFRDPLNPSADQARLLDQALRNAAQGDLGRVISTSQLLLPELSTLPRIPETAPFALTFAAAALTAGDNPLAQAWLGATEFEGLEPPDAFAIARLEALDLISGGDQSRASQTSVQARLIDAAETDLQKADAAHVLTLWQGFGLSLGPEARGLISTYGHSGRRLSSGKLTELEAAAQAGAIGEAVFLILSATDREPDVLAARDLAELIKALRRVDAEDIAQDLAIEASNLWSE